MTNPGQFDEAEFMNSIKAISKYVLAIFMIVAGIMHFVNPTFFLKIMPPYLPLHEELVLVSGVFEVFVGLLLLVPQTSRLAGWGIVALLVAVFPANLYLYQHQGHSSGIADHSSAAITVAGRLYFLGVLAYKTGKVKSVNLKMINISTN